MLVDAALTLRAGEGIDRTDHDRVLGAPVPVLATRAGGRHEPEDRRHREDTSHRIIVITRLAAAWVAAGTVQVPEAHRCHESSSPAPRSTGKTATP